MKKCSILWRVGIALVVFSLAACSAASPVLSDGAASSPTAPPQAVQTQSPRTQAMAAPATPSTAAAPAITTSPAPTTANIQPTAASMACTVPTSLTPPVTEGPYFKAGSPEKSSLIGSLPGMKLVLNGYVLDADCKPVAGALLDFWQADSQGNYDNAGYTLRGHQYSAADGSYRLETVVPGLYPGRTEHIHFKVQAKGGPVLTSQLFFPGVTQNQSDGIYIDKLQITVRSASATEMAAAFNFIIATK